MSRHKGARVKNAGIFVKKKDYNGDYAIEFQTENDQAYEFILQEEQVEHLNTLTEKPVGVRTEEGGIISSLLFWR